MVLAAACTIALAPVGDAPAGALQELTAVVRETFGCEVVLAARVPLARAAFAAERDQHHSTVILDAPAAARRPGWERLLGVADVDLYVPDLNFVFGEADARRGVAVFSLFRLRAGADEALFRRRAATEAVHELGHTYGLGHCRDPCCVMWFSNTLAESDPKGTRFCAAHTTQFARTRARR